MNPRSRRIRRLAGALAAAGLALGLTLGATGTARADVTPPASTWSEIYNPYLTAQGNTLCADDANGSKALNTPVQLYHCHGYAANGAPQRWSFVEKTDAKDVPILWNGHPVYSLYNLGSGSCLEITDPPGSGFPGAPLGTQLQLGLCGQYYALLPVGGPNGPDFQLQSVRLFGGYCVAASNFTDSNNTRLVKEDCSPTDTRQLFRLG
jgi:hypothetical protein